MRDYCRAWIRAGAKCEMSVAFGIVQSRNVRLPSLWNRAAAKSEILVASEWIGRDPRNDRVFWAS